MRKHLLIFTATCCLTNASYALTLDEALINAYQHNQSLLAQREVLKKTDEQATQVLTKFLPSISASSQSAKSNTTFPKFGQLSKGTSTTNTLQLNQNVFNGGKDLVNIKTADNIIKNARAALQDMEQKVLLTVIDAYVRVVKSKEITSVNQQNVATLKKHLQSVEERFEQGEVTRTDVASSKASLAKAKSDLAAAEGDYQINMASFEQIVGLPATDVKQPASIKDIPISLDEALKLSLTNHPQIIAASFNSAALEKRVTTSKMGLLPNATLQASIAKTASSDQRVNSGLAGDSKTKSLTLNVTVPIFSSGAEYSQIREAKSDLRKSKYDLKNAVDQTKQATIKAWQGVETSTASIIFAEEAVAAATIALEGTTQEAEVGTKTNLEVLDAELKLFDAKVQLIQANSTRIYSLYAIKSAIGDLNATSLKLATTIYDPTENYKNVRFKFFGFEDQ